LKRLPEAFNPPFGLGRVGTYMANPELVQGSSKLGKGYLLSSQFFFDGEFVRLGGEKDGVTVTVHAPWYPMFHDNLTQDLEIALEVFLRTKMESQHFAGGGLLYC